MSLSSTGLERECLNERAGSACAAGPVFALNSDFSRSTFVEPATWREEARQVVIELACIASLARGLRRRTTGLMKPSSCPTYVRKIDLIRE